MFKTKKFYTIQVFLYFITDLNKIHLSEFKIDYNNFYIL